MRKEFSIKVKPADSLPHLLLMAYVAVDKSENVCTQIP